MKELVALLQQNKCTISSVESFTVGNFGARLGQIPGVSSVYTGSIVSYQTKIKETLVGISSKRIEEYGVVSEEIAHDMCYFGKQLLDSTICVSFTGNAGPSVMEQKPVGCVYIGIHFFDEIEVYECSFKGDRQQIQDCAILFVKNKLIEKLKEL